MLSRCLLFSIINNTDFAMDIAKPISERDRSGWCDKGSVNCSQLGLFHFIIIITATANSARVIKPIFTIRR